MVECSDSKFAPRLFRRRGLYIGFFPHIASSDASNRTLRVAPSGTVASTAQAGKQYIYFINPGDGFYMADMFQADPLLRTLDLLLVNRREIQN
jgi:hypothetical protein